MEVLIILNPVPKNNSMDTSIYGIIESSTTTSIFLVIFISDAEGV